MWCLSVFAILKLKSFKGKDLNHARAGQRRYISKCLLGTYYNNCKKVFSSKHFEETGRGRDLKTRVTEHKKKTYIVKHLLESNSRRKISCWRETRGTWSFVEWLSSKYHMILYSEIRLNCMKYDTPIEGLLCIVK